MKWGKRYSASHCAWILTLADIDLEWTMFLADPIKTACIEASMFPLPPFAPMLFETEDGIDRVLAALLTM